MFEIDSNDFGALTDTLADISSKQLSREQAMKAVNFFKNELSIDKRITS